MHELFPIFLKLAGRRCLVVGGGAVAEAKIHSLLRCGAEVRVIAPEVTPCIRDIADLGQIVCEQRCFIPADLAGVFLVIAATNSPELHEEIFRRCQRAGILCNAADDPDRCDFYYPAVVRRGPLQVAISTAGHSPFLAQRLRRELEARFVPEYGPWVEEIGRERAELFRAGISAENRRSILKELASERSFSEFQARQESASESRRGKVYFVGAGTGDPELLTRKAWKVLRIADMVLHDALVSPEILNLLPKETILCDVGKRCGAKSVTQAEIHALLIGSTSTARIVVRLQGGDPLIFGRMGEEISALREAGVEFEIIPGVTAASAAAASSQIALTDRRLASQLIFLSAHRQQAEFERDLKSLPRTRATLVIYMPGSNYPDLARVLRDTGMAGETPCLIASKVSTARESIYRTNLASLPGIATVPPPSLLIVGAVAAVARCEDPAAVISPVLST